MFADKGLFVPVKDCKCIINTGGAQPNSVLKINDGPRETPVMCKCIVSLYERGQIDQLIDGVWLFKATLAPQLHQEHTIDSCDFVCRFCVN